MKVAPLPPNEAARLEALRRAVLLDTLPEAEFDDAARLASIICRTPIALVSLVDEHRQWFKARVGLSAHETPREVAFCAHAILEGGTFIVPDAQADERFRDNPLVISDPRIRFYAGAVLNDEGGFPLGTLCVIDHVPRHLDEEQREALAALARTVTALLQLRRARNDAEETLDNALDLLQTLDEEGRFLYVNRAWLDALGYTRAEAGALDLFAVIAPDHHGSCRAMLERVHLGENVRNVETVFLTKSGARLVVEGTARAAVDAYGRRVTRSVFRDITERKAAEASLEASELQFRTLAQNAPIGIYRTDARGRCVYTNARWRELSGLGAEEALGDGWLTAIHPEDQAAVEREWLDNTGAGSAFAAAPFRFLTRGGSEKWVRSRAAALRDEDGVLTGYLGSVEDITDLHVVTLALRESASFQRTLLDAASLIIISTDVDGRVRSINAGAQRALGYTSDELVGKPPPAALHDAAEIAARAKELSAELGERIKPSFDVLVAKARRGLTDENEWSYFRKDGTSFPVRLTVTAARDDRGELVGFLGVGKDISEERRSLKARNEVERLKDEFVSTVSHELRTPLTSIRGALSLLHGKVVDLSSSKGEELVRIAHANAERLIRLVNDILDLEKIEAGKLDLRSRSVAALKIIEGAIASTTAIASAAGIELAVIAEDGLELEADEDRLVQVLTNFISNALKFTPRGEVVRVTCAGSDGGVRFEVVDRGPGIAPEQQHTLFERFRQIDTSDARPRGGTGLGLAICKAIVEEHGGHVGLVSSRGLGSTFWFTVPLVRLAQAKA